jgi:D-arabinose 1-dehydrogenase-like Zn-dependent alcohol dehydrogenase
MSKFGLAAVCDSPNTPLELREYGVRDVEADEVLVRVTMATICGSDIYSYH